jgi:predicted nucleic acid-binding protein
VNLYLDASALVKRYVQEEGTDALVRAMSGVREWSMCRIGFVETARAVARGGRRSDLAGVERDWIHFDVIELDEALAGSAARLSIATGLRTLDALHLAAALSLDGDDVTFATWDARLHRAAREHGLRTLPAALA